MALPAIGYDYCYCSQPCLQAQLAVKTHVFTAVHVEVHVFRVILSWGATWRIHVPVVCCQALSLLVSPPAHWAQLQCRCVVAVHMHMPGLRLQGASGAPVAAVIVCVIEATPMLWCARMAMQMDVYEWHMEILWDNNDAQHIEAGHYSQQAPVAAPPCRVILPALP